MQRYEQEYAKLIKQIIYAGDHRQGRNGGTLSIFGMSLAVPVRYRFPLLQGRKMYPKGVLGEFAAFVRQPKTLEDFTKWGCNYWEKWAKPDGSINVDYGNSWFDFNGVNQVAELKETLQTDPFNRRMIINAWRPDRLNKLSLPCCHYSYQFYVSSSGVLSMIWTQRSVDMMIGLPSDIILGAIWLITLAHEFNLTPGYVKFDLGDCHIYDEHFANAGLYVDRVEDSKIMPSVKCDYIAPTGQAFEKFEPEQLVILDYEHLSPLKFELKD